MIESISYQGTVNINMWLLEVVACVGYISSVLSRLYMTVWKAGKKGNEKKDASKIVREEKE